MKPAQSLDILGRCYCGGVCFSIAADTEPYWAGYCHCKDCRQSHASPLYQYAYIRQQEFRVIEGENFLEWYTRSKEARDRFRRFFCKRCGTRVYNTYLYKTNGEEVALCGLFPSLLDDQETATNSIWSPRRHVFCGESIMDISLLSDGLPKFERNDT